MGRKSDCKTCKGSGIKECTVKVDGDMLGAVGTCTTCKGKGVIYTDEGEDDYKFLYW